MLVVGALALVVGVAMAVVPTSAARAFHYVRDLAPDPAWDRGVAPATRWTGVALFALGVVLVALAIV